MVKNKENKVINNCLKWLRKLVKKVIWIFLIQSLQGKLIWFLNIQSQSSVSPSLRQLNPSLFALFISQILLLEILSVALLSPAFLTCIFSNLVFLLTLDQKKNVVLLKLSKMECHKARQKLYFYRQAEPFS